MGKTRKRLQIKRDLPFILIIFLISLSFIYIYRINFTEKESPYLAQRGSVDLSKWNLDGTIDLDGYWEFYPNHLIDPSKEDFDDYQDKVTYIKVPDSWTDSNNESMDVGNSGSYRLKIKLPQDAIYGLKTRTIRLSNQVYINKEEVISTGKPSLDEDDFIPESKYKLGFGKSLDKEIELVILVSSHNYRTGGIIKSIEFATDQGIIKRDRIDRLIDGFIISICIVLGLYFFLTYLNRGKEIYLFYFSGTSIFMGLYLSTMGDQLLGVILNYGFIGRTKIQLLAMIMTTVCVLNFTYHFFEQYLERRGSRLLTVGLLLNLLFLLLNDENNNFMKYSNIVQGLVSIFVISSYIYISGILVKVLYKRVDSSAYVGVIASSLFGYWFSLFMKIFFELDLGYLPLGLISLMLISTALLMSNKQQEDYQEVIGLSNRLTAYDKINKEYFSKAGLNEVSTVLIIGHMDKEKEIVDILKELGLNSIVTDSGKEAVDIVNQNKIDMIILDHILSDISGEKLCFIIRESYSIVELPILFLTSSPAKQNMVRAFQCGANDYVKKPIDRNELKTRIKSLLNIKSSVEEGLKKEFQYFYSQISPHFLYNTINTIIGLSYKDNELARKALNNLSIYFRGKLDYHRNHSLISLENELDLVRAYLEIEEMRYGSRLKVIYDIEEDIDVSIPPLTLQPIVENAIKHGISKKENGGWIKISIKRKSKDCVKIVVEDNGLGIDKEKQKQLMEGSSQRIGFKNIVEKLKILKGADISIESKIEQGTKISISLKEVRPLETYIS